MITVIAKLDKSSRARLSWIQSFAASFGIVPRPIYGHIPICSIEEGQIEGIKAAVWAAVGSEKIPGSSNNDYNYQFGNWNVIIWPYLNDFIGSLAAPWIIMDSKYCQECDVAIKQEREPLTVTSVIDDNDANRWKGRARFGGGFVDFRGMLAGGLAAGGNL